MSLFTYGIGCFLWCLIYHWCLGSTWSSLVGFCKPQSQVAHQCIIHCIGLMYVGDVCIQSVRKHLLCMQAEQATMGICVQFCYTIKLSNFFMHICTQATSIHSVIVILFVNFIWSSDHCISAVSESVCFFPLLAVLNIKAGHQKCTTQHEVKERLMP